MKVSKHAKKRIKSRLGLPIRAHLRHIAKVIQEGELYKRYGAEKFEMIYQRKLYIFGLRQNLEAQLITVFPLKESFKLSA